MFKLIKLLPYLTLTLIIEGISSSLFKNFPKYESKIELCESLWIIDCLINFFIELSNKKLPLKAFVLYSNKMPSFTIDFL